jgi:hypothetical protein
MQHTKLFEALFAYVNNIQITWKTIHWPRAGEANQLFSVYIALWRSTALAIIYNVVGRQRNLGLRTKVPVEFWLSLCKIVRSSVILLLPLFIFSEIYYSLVPLLKQIIIRYQSVLQERKGLFLHVICGTKPKVPVTCSCMDTPLYMW